MENLFSNLLKDFSTNFLNLIFPCVCYNCQKKIIGNSILCPDCENKLEPLKKPVHTQNTEKDLYFDFAVASVHYNNVIRSLIHAFKYQELLKVAEYLTNERLTQAIEIHLQGMDYICPIPLHKVKKRMRGFNQAELISKLLSQKLKVTHIPDLLIRKNFTKTQTKLTREERQKNVKDVFKVNDNYNVNGKNIIIVDDVFTTGSTANSAAKALSTNKTDKVVIYTVAKAKH